MIEEDPNSLLKSEEIANILNIEGGSLNENFLVKTNTDGNLYVQKNFLQYEHLIKIEFLMKIIQEAGVPLKTNQRILRLKDMNIFIREFVEGRTYKLGDIEDLRTAIGILTTLHGVDVSNIENIKYKYLSVHDPYHWINHFEENFKKMELWTKQFPDLGFLLDILKENYYSEMKKEYEQLPMAITHGDLHGGNLIYNSKNHEILSVIDFDTLSISSRISDISYSWFLLCRENRGSFEINQQLSDYFFNEYSNKIILKKDEFKLLRSVLIMRLMPTPIYLYELKKKRNDYFVQYLQWVKTAIGSLDANLKKIDERFFNG